MPDRHIMVQHASMAEPAGFCNVATAMNLFDWQSDLVQHGFKHPNLLKMTLEFEEGMGDRTVFFTDPIAKPSLRWRDVFYTDHKGWTGVDSALATARASGYKYMSWNSDVIRLDDGVNIGSIYDLIEEEKPPKETLK